MMRRVMVALACLALSVVPQIAQPQGVATSVTRRNDQIFVSGREVRFEHLGTSHGEPVVRVDDAGLASMLQILGAKVQFEPGTRFVVFTRADGELITLTVGSDVVSTDDTSTTIPFGPFYENGQLYVPLLALTRALGLFARHFRGGYAFAPQIILVQRHIGQRRTVVEIRATAPLGWRSTFDGPPKHPTFTLTFPGFANAAGATIDLGGREAKIATLDQQGPPGYPITSLTIDVIHGGKFNRFDTCPQRQGSRTAQCDCNAFGADLDNSQSDADAISNRGTHSGADYRAACVYDQFRYARSQSRRITGPRTDCGAGA
jgi:hypothetical protein